MSIQTGFLPAIIKRFEYYKELGDKTFAQLGENEFFFQPSTESNSIAIIIQHFYGNAMSRWTNFMTEDGEKQWRNRDGEFVLMDISQQDLMSFWNTGWSLILSTLKGLSEADLDKTIFIRSEPLLVYDAILRQLAHYSYHIGQIVYLGKIQKDKNFKSLSIPKERS